MRFITAVIFLFLIQQASYGMEKGDSLLAVLKTAQEDTNKVNTLISLSKYYVSTDPKETIHCGELAQQLSEKLNFTKGLAFAYKSIGMGYYFQGKYLETLDYWD